MAFQALSYQFSSSTELLTSLAAEWYDVRLVVALVKQGSALLARGWVTAQHSICNEHTYPNGLTGLGFKANLTH